MVLANLSLLPYDILRILTRLIDGAEVVHVLSTCKTLHVYLKDDAIWQDQCARYYVTDRGLFSGETFFFIYSEVVHKYGPLLGLWASDNPYRGSVVEFRLDANAHGITGEVWQFRSGLSAAATQSRHVPNLPGYHRFVTISLSPITRQVQTRWHSYQDNDDSVPFESADRLLSFHVLSATNESQYYYHITGSSRLPDFPDPDQRPWYDDTRGLPRVQTEPAPMSSAVNPSFTPCCPFLYTAQTEAVKPAALSISYNDRRFPDVHAIWGLGAHIGTMFHDLRSFDLNGTIPRPGPLFLSRFYPLRFPSTVGDNPADDGWRPSTLEGIWLGPYVTHGTEVLYVYVDEAAREIRAMKVTGDMNVPQGAVSWAFRLEDRLHPHELPRDADGTRLSFGDDQDPLRTYRGWGTISGHGYMEELRARTNVYACVASPDEIRVIWYDLDPTFAPRYKRHKGRDVASETEDQYACIRRPAGW
ncbi:hypothetical protein PHLGIDRAFT_407495 [Phlebiopsis gigantea 11061_1 CR5-6]|uniref:F-box domain-containing protein n=1 Tax=Phlebiopsis gigantea (strain 11061_1 CR5-6) TaxID=745531 RepID=A0A0C3NRN1_PHLG1|nr:hypothetical protein PHLGIDRAFT_407495 [Phlebiopsis gigantea 11061_1 CR5-6]